MNNQQKISENEIILDQNFWNYRWENQLTGWDIGEPSPAIAAYFDQFANKDIALLIPGCGNAHEVGYLLDSGYTDITLVDIAPKAVEILQEKFINNKEVKVYCQDFYEHQGLYDLIVEQTFFCTMPLSLRPNYVEKAQSLLKENGKLVGLLFNKFFEQPGPPFGGSIESYQTLFEPKFIIKTLDECYNSIEPRKKTEVFINFIKKKVL